MVVVLLLIICYHNYMKAEKLLSKCEVLLESFHVA